MPDVLYSSDFEKLVLGCMFMSTNAFSKAVNSLEVSDFYLSEHQEIFEILVDFHRDEKPADIHLVCLELKDRKKMEAGAAAAYLADLADRPGVVFDIGEYVDELKKFSSRRYLLSLSKTIENDVVSHKNPYEIALNAQEEIKNIEKQKGLKDKFQTRFLDQFEQNYLVKEPHKKQMLLEYSGRNGSPIGFLPKGIVAMLVGSGGVGKTHLLVQLAISIATGMPFLDKYTIPVGESERRGNVFIGLGENQYEDIHRAFYKSGKKLRESQQKNLAVEASKRIAAFSFCGQQAAFIHEKKPSLYFRELKMRLEDIAPARGWSLIILDPISRLLGADAELDNAAATQFISLLEELAMDLPGNPTVLFAHHVNKSSMREGDKQGQSAARGASALTDGVRWQANLTKTSDQQPIDCDILVLKVTKTNFTAVIEDQKLRRDKTGYISNNEDRKNSRVEF